MAYLSNPPAAPTSTQTFQVVPTCYQCRQIAVQTLWWLIRPCPYSSRYDHSGEPDLSVAPHHIVRACVCRSVHWDRITVSQGKLSWIRLLTCSSWSWSWEWFARGWRAEKTGTQEYACSLIWPFLGLGDYCEWSKRLGMGLNRNSSTVMVDIVLCVMS
jgi:hypothetical protein